MSSTPDPSELPAVDERVVAPDTRYEIVDGKLVYVPPALEPHAELHSAIDGLLRGCRADGYNVAVDMLTRTSRTNDFAPDVSVYPSARDPETGRRQLEELAFEVVSTEALSVAGDKASKLVARGVRRVFAIDVERRRVLEWSRDLETWGMLDRAGEIVDRALAVPVPVHALVDAGAVDGATVRAFRAKRHPEFVAEREEGREEGRAEGRALGMGEALLAVRRGRGLEGSRDARDRILAERDTARIQRWLAATASCASVDELLAIG